jgi:hypothetical protein
MGGSMTPLTFPRRRRPALPRHLPPLLPGIGRLRGNLASAPAPSWPPSTPPLQLSHDALARVSAR